MGWARDYRALDGSETEQAEKQATNLYGIVTDRGKTGNLLGPLTGTAQQRRVVQSIDSQLAAYGEQAEVHGNRHVCEQPQRIRSEISRPLGKAPIADGQGARIGLLHTGVPKGRRFFH